MKICKSCSRLYNDSKQITDTDCGLCGKCGPEHYVHYRHSYPIELNSDGKPYAKEVKFINTPTYISDSLTPKHSLQTMESLAAIALLAHETKFIANSINDSLKEVSIALHNLFSNSIPKTESCIKEIERQLMRWKEVLEFAKGKQ